MSRVKSASALLANSGSGTCTHTCIKEDARCGYTEAGDASSFRKHVSSKPVHPDCSKDCPSYISTILGERLFRIGLFIKEEVKQKHWSEAETLLGFVPCDNQHGTSYINHIRKLTDQELNGYVLEDTENNRIFINEWVCHCT